MSGLVRVGDAGRFGWTMLEVRLEAMMVAESVCKSIFPAPLRPPPGLGIVPPFLFC